MFFLKRAWYYVSRKLGKIVVIGIILFIVSSLVLTGLVINSAANKASVNARNKLGVNVSYTTDLSSVFNNESGNTRGQGGGFRAEMPDDFTNITTKEIETIANNSKYVKNYVISANMSGKAVDFDYYNPFDSVEDSDSGASLSINGNQFRIEMNVSLNGLDKKSKNEQFDLESLIDGSYFTDEQIDNQENVIIIEQTLATINNIKIGDKITISKIDMAIPSQGSTASPKEIEIEFEVIGIYKTETPTDLTSNGRMPASALSENLMYAPYTSILVSNLAGLEGDELETAKALIEENGYEVSQVTFNLKDPSDIEAFIAEVKNMQDVDTTYRSLSANDAAYEKMMGPIDNVASTSTVLVLVVIFAGAFIIGLLSMLSIKDRKYELGVLLSLGESRFKIVSQLVTEMLMVAIIAFSLSTLASNYVAQGVTNYLLNQEIASQDNDENNNTNNIMGGPRMIRGGGISNFTTANRDVIDVDTIDTLTVTVNVDDILKMFGIGILIIIIGNASQSLFVLKAKPKEILMER